MPIMAITIAMVIAPLDLVPPWIAPLPDTPQFTNMDMMVGFPVTTVSRAIMKILTQSWFSL